MWYYGASEIYGDITWRNHIIKTKSKRTINHKRLIFLETHSTELGAQSETKSIMFVKTTGIELKFKKLIEKT